MVETHVSSVSKGRIKRLCVGREKVSDICEAFNLKLLGFLLNHFPKGGNILNNQSEWDIDIHVKVISQM